MARIGLGTDLHRLEQGRPLFIGGVKIPAPFGAVGHSDGDVVLHALADALLGAIGEDDIGVLFPDTDPRWRGLSSDRILTAAVERVVARGQQVVHVDVVVDLQAPKLADQRPAIRANLSQQLGLAPDRVGFKAKTGEGLGAVGEGRAIGCQAIVLVIPVSP